MKVTTEFEIEVWFPWDDRADIILIHSVAGSTGEEEKISFEDVLNLTMDGLTPEEQIIVKRQIAGRFRKFLEKLEGRND